MGERICSVDDCDSPANVPGSGRGMCGKHYQRWRKHGDAEYVKPTIVGVAPCSVAGCSTVVKARGWCIKHYTRWNRYGDPEARVPGEIVDGHRICPMCGEDKPLSLWGRGYCKACMTARMRVHRLENPYVPVAGEPYGCDHCGQAFMANKRRSRYCSASCSATVYGRRSFVRSERLRAATVEKFDRDEIFERDGWVCQLCDAALSPETKWPEPNFPTIDHIIPIILGGEHSRANVQTACLDCNVRKGPRLAA